MADHDICSCLFLTSMDADMEDPYCMIYLQGCHLGEPTSDLTSLIRFQGPSQPVESTVRTYPRYVCLVVQCVYIDMYFCLWLLGYLLS